MMANMNVFSMAEITPLRIGVQAIFQERTILLILYKRPPLNLTKDQNQLLELLRTAAGTHRGSLLRVSGGSGGLAMLVVSPPLKRRSDSNTV
jgi:hypothetical protein